MAYTREIINVGTTADDGSGDYLRDALIKTNTNFQNLWQVGAVDTNLDLTGTTIASVTANSDITLDPNGTGKIVLSSSVEPDTTDSKDLGSATKSWKDVHANTVYADKTVFNAQSSAPSSPVDGTLYYNTSTDQFVGYVDGVWKNLMIGTAGLQSLWERITSDAGTTTANSATDNLTIAGGTGITTAITGDTLTITNSNNLTASSTNTFTNKSGAISQWTNDSGYLTSVPAQSFASLTGKPTTIGGYGITDSVTSNSTHSFTNKSGNISQWTNDSGYITSSSGWNIAADDSAVKLIRINDDLKIAGGTGITTAMVGDVLTITNTVAAGTVTATSSTAFTNKTGAISQWTNDSGYLTSVPAQSFASLTGKPTTIAGYGITDSVTSSSSTAFTNKSGNISQWTNDSGYTTNVGDVTASSSTAFTNKSGNISQWTNDSNYLTSVPAQSFASLTGKPTTLAGYGISDGYDNGDVDTHLNQSNPTSGHVLSWNGSDYAWVANAGGGYGNSDVDTHLNQSNPTSGYVLSWNGSDYAWVSNSGGGGGDPDQNLFATVTGDSGTTTANTTNDTLTIAGGTGITTAVSGDTLTITGVAQNFAFASLTGKPTTIAGYGITDSVTATSSHAFTNKTGAISQWTNDSGYTTNVGDVTASSTTAFTNKSGAISQWTNDSGYLTSTGVLSSHTDVHTASPTDGQVLKWDDGNSRWAPADDANTDSVTASSTTTFTNKSGAISQWTNDSNYSTTTGTVTSVAGGTGLTGGTITSTGTLAVDVGTTANKIVQLDGSAKLPAVDGSALTNLPAAGTPNGSNTHVQFNDSGSFGGDAGLTYNKTTDTLTAKNIVTESITADSGLSGTYTISSPTTITLDPVTEVILDAPMKLKSYALASVPSASAGSVISISDRASKPAYYDGTNWRFFSNDSIVS